MRIIFFSVLLAISSLAHANEILNLEQELNAFIMQKSSSERSKLTQLREFSKRLNQYAPNFHQGVINDLDSKKPLHGQQLTILHKIVSVYITLGYQFESVARDTSNDAYKVLAGLDSLESFEKVYMPYYEHSRFRRYINAQDDSFDIKRYELKRLIKSVISSRRFSYIKSNMYQAHNNSKDVEIRNSIRYHYSMDFLLDPFDVEMFKLKMKVQGIFDYAANEANSLLNFISKSFGNSVGKVRWRKGHLLKNEIVLKEIYNNLRPLDVITEKTYFALTDTLIPGHFGHNAIWLGTKKQLIQLGMWNHPAIRPHQAMISAGKSIIEADRSGTHFKSLEEFMNVDEFAILRLKPEYFTLPRIQETFEVAISQLGKVYDFNFDVETTDKIVCSELLYQSFGDIHWPTEPYLGRTTISPDNVTSLVLYDDSPIELIYYVAEKDKGYLRYKDMDDLANDMGFTKVNNSYKKPVKTCKIVETNRVWRGRARGYIMENKKECEISLFDLDYQHHADLGDVPSLDL